jgi:hypothetical protein
MCKLACAILGYNLVPGHEQLLRRASHCQKDGGTKQAESAIVELMHKACYTRDQKLFPEHFLLINFIHSCASGQ